MDKYLGLEFIHGKQDCYELARMVFKDKLGITLSQYARPDDWWLTDKNLYMNNFKKEGFYILPDDEEIRLYDIFLIALPDQRKSIVPPNHCAIYIGDGKVLHHRLGKRSEIKTYAGMLKKFTSCVIRHKSMKHTEPTVSRKDIMEYLLPSKRQKIEKIIQENERNT